MPQEESKNGKAVSNTRKKLRVCSLSLSPYMDGIDRFFLEERKREIDR